MHDQSTESTSGSTGTATRATVKAENAKSADTSVEAIKVALLHLYAHEERVACIGGRRNGEFGLAVNRRIKGNIDIVG